MLIKISFVLSGARDNLPRIDAVSLEAIDDAAAHVFARCHKVASGGCVDGSGKRRRAANPETVRESCGVIVRFAEG
jgi:hypothetical protein